MVTEKQQMEKRRRLGTSGYLEQAIADGAEQRQCCAAAQDAQSRQKYTTTLDHYLDSCEGSPLLTNKIEDLQPV